MAWGSAEKVGGDNWSYKLVRARRAWNRAEFVLLSASADCVCIAVVCKKICNRIGSEGDSIRKVTNIN